MIRISGFGSRVSGFDFRVSIHVAFDQNGHARLQVEKSKRDVAFRKGKSVSFTLRVLYQCSKKLQEQNKLQSKTLPGKKFCFTTLPGKGQIKDVGRILRSIK